MKTFAAALFVTGLLAAGAANADIVVEGNSIFDTESGLTWQEQLIPTATFIAMDGWGVASESQFDTLIVHAGLTSPGPKAAWVSALYSLPDSYQGPYIYNPWISASLCSAGTSSRCFNAPSFHYQEVDAAAGLYAFVASLLPTDQFGPGYSPSGGPWDVPYVASLVVNQPVPLPAACWLFLSALPALLRVGLRKKHPGSDAAREPLRLSLPA